MSANALSECSASTNAVSANAVSAQQLEKLLCARVGFPRAILQLLRLAAAHRDTARDQDVDCERKWPQPAVSVHKVAMICTGCTPSSLSKQKILAVNAQNLCCQCTRSLLSLHKILAVNARDPCCQCTRSSLSMHEILAVNA